MKKRGCPISRLGDDIVAHILSFLPIDAVVRTSLLSRQWNMIWTRVPMSDLHIQLVKTGSETTCATKLQALSFLTSFVSLQKTNGLNSKRLIRLSVFLDTRSVASAFGNLVAMARSCGFELDLDIRTHEDCSQEYLFPEAVCSATSLISLRLQDRLSNTLFIPTLNWHNLRVLYLSTSGFMDPVKLPDRLAASCPLLESLVFDRCLFDAGQLRLAGFRKLLRFKFRGGKADYYDCLIWKVTIKDTPKLQVLHCRGTRLFRIQVEVDPATAGQKLEVLKLKFCISSDKLIFQDLQSRFHSLKFLLLKQSSTLNMACLQSHTLEGVRLLDPGFVNVRLDTPNLKSLEFSCTRVMPMFEVERSRLQTVDFSGFFSDHCNEKSFRLAKQAIHHFTHVELLICYFDFRTIAFKTPRKEPHLPEMINEIRIGCKYYPKWKDSLPIATSLHYGMQLVEGLFWMCRPQAVSCAFGEGNNNEFLQALGIKLSERIRECAKRHRTNRCKHLCWQRKLKRVRVRFREVEIEGAEATKLLMPLTSVEVGEIVTLNLEWESQTCWLI